MSCVKINLPFLSKKCLTALKKFDIINYATPLPGSCLSLIAGSPRVDDWATKARQLWQTKNVTARRSNLSFNYPARPVRLSHGCAFCSLVPGLPGAKKNRVEAERLDSTPQPDLRNKPL
jgi:hypothetical protein